MPVSGVVISCQPGSTDNVAAVLRNISQLELHHRLENGTLVAVLETVTVEEEVALVTEIMQVDGVMDVRLAYHNFEDLPELHL